MSTGDIEIGTRIEDEDVLLVEGLDVEDVTEEEDEQPLKGEKCCTFVCTSLILFGNSCAIFFAFYRTEWSDYTRTRKCITINFFLVNAIIASCMLVMKNKNDDEEDEGSLAVEVDET